MGKKISKRSLITFLVGIVALVVASRFENPLLKFALYLIAGVLIIMSSVFQSKDKSIV